MTTKDAYVQVGVTAMRSPSGDFLPSVPLYIRVPEKVIGKSGLTATEEQPCRDVAGIFANIHREYMKLLKQEEESYANA